MSGTEHILVVDDSPTQLVQLRLMLEEGGFAVKTVSDGMDALESIGEEMPEIVITDLQMPNMNGLRLVEEIKCQYPSLPVILTTSQGSEDIAVEALNQGASSYVPKREMASTLVSTVEQVMGVARANKSLREIENYTTASAVELRLPPDETLIPHVISRIESVLKEVGLFDEAECMQIAMALDEALTNAMIHGNLEVSSELRQQDDGQPYVDMIAERKCTEPFCNRAVVIRVDADQQQATFVIRDEGPGFDPGSLPDPTDPENLEKAGGRGLLLINSFMDSVSFNEKANEITMIKNRSEDEDCCQSN